MANSTHPLLDTAKQFSKEVLRPNAAQFDAEQGVPESVLREMCTSGLAGAVLPEEYGGGGVDALTWGLITEEIGVGCSNTRALLTVHSSLVGETIARLGTDTQKQDWLPQLAKGERIGAFALSEKDAGSDASAVATRFEEKDDHFVLNGKKKWITYAAVANLFLVFAASEDGSTNAFLVEREREGLSTTPMTGLFASRGAHLGEITFDNVKIPKENLFGRPGMGFTFVANQALFYGRFSIAWAGVAIARSALEEMVTWSRTRKQFGSKIGQHQLVQAMIADGVTSVHAGRAMCEKISHMKQANDDAAVMETNITKLFTSRIATEVANNAVQIFGGNGLWQAYPAERLYREARVLEIIEGTTQIQQMMIANYGLRQYFKTGLKKLYPE
ncbi:acyl-CoA dehydrogenase family protein [Alteromonas sp. a30]|uniref:acyl-CoA dehydrogenase family protein n=1 Tax=Alteromonas sp. a30 TaxID=2730917 RepID=UPI00227E488B|nr:acyl-CoA dehydrogenase family protein [Alteromonas sp. a30]MCY7295207.1 acyl-CoA dehydrogenase [Alteromonas sp. a30]